MEGMGASMESSTETVECAPRAAAKLVTNLTSRLGGVVQQLSVLGPRLTTARQRAHGVVSSGASCTFSRMCLFALLFRRYVWQLLE